VQGLLNLFPGQASNPANLDTYLSLWAGLARLPPMAAASSGSPEPQHGRRAGTHGGDAGLMAGTDKCSLVAGRCRPSLCAALLGRMRVAYLLGAMPQVDCCCLLAYSPLCSLMHSCVSCLARLGA
jgi:hypothetical protein